MGRAFKILCPVCHSKTTIRKSEWRDPKVGSVYCACNNVECGYTFVFDVIFSHALNPSKLNTPEIVTGLLDRMTPKEKQIALEFLQGQEKEDD